MPSVLLFGSDLKLLSIRHMIMSRSGYAATEASRVAEVMELLSQRQFDLLIICHSVSSVDRAAVAALASAANPQTVCLAMWLGMREKVKAPCILFDAADGPARLMAQVNQLTRRPSV